jgi:hypothetical protein
MTANIESNERTAEAQEVGRQPDGPGRRIGKKGEVSFFLPLAPDGAKSSGIAYRNSRPRPTTGKPGSERFRNYARSSSTMTPACS